MAHHQATVDLRVGGSFCYHMAAKDGSASFDFEGIYTNIEQHKRIESVFGGRALKVEFIETASGVVVRETFEAESIHSVAEQRHCGPPSSTALPVMYRRNKNRRQPNNKQRFNLGLVIALHPLEKLLTEAANCVTVAMYRTNFQDIPQRPRTPCAGATLFN